MAVSFPTLSRWYALSVCQSARTAETEYLFSHSPGGWTPKTKVLAGLVSDETFLLGVQVAAVLLSSHMAFSLSTYTPGAPSAYKAPVLLYYSPTLVTLFDLIDSLKAYLPICYIGG